MAYAVSFDEYYPASDYYEGACEHFTAEFTGTPGLRGTIKETVTTWCWAEGATILRFRLMQDTAPTFDKYLIDVWAHGSPAIGWALLVGVIIGMAIVGMLWWAFTDENWVKEVAWAAKNWKLLLSVGVGLVAGYFILDFMR
jgi:hypothetical protein